ncbi:protein-L-isoaspartate(D-aspartate) O-methyltransferase [bacterium]|nr:protein-L-isoaspartate(D-aspartate) O-methyltransferase [bacterium]
MTSTELARQKMIDTLRKKGIDDERVLEVMANIKRHLFVPEELEHRAYEDGPLPIGEHQTISQPYMVAYMTHLLNLTGRERILEIGTGSGYQTAILAQLSAVVFTMERFVTLAQTAKAHFEMLGINNIVQKVGDGTMGWGEEAPFDRIIVTAGAPEIPRIYYAQLAENGILVIPSGSRRIQELKLIEKKQDETITTSKGGCVFVPLIGSQGWK